jgi:hypothetical protein
MCWYYHNATNSCGASSTIKHISFQPCILEKSLIFNGANHYIKSFHVCQEMTIHAIGIPIQCESNTIKMKRWNFTSLMPKVKSIQIALLCPHVSINSNWAMVNGVWIPPYLSFTQEKKHHPNDYMPRFESRWWGWHAIANFLPCAFDRYRWCHFVKWTHLSSWAPPHWPMPTKSPYVCYIFTSLCAPSSIGPKCGP